jgi:hypothetical protein
MFRILAAAVPRLATRHGKTLKADKPRENQF